MRTLPYRLISIALMSISINLKAQQPILKVDPKDSANVSLSKLKTEVKVIGNYAVTIMEMEFCNTAPRVLEGELVFPMPEGVTVSRYAIDINGKMREAVPVEKEKGQVVFENIERRRVDPGLLEKVQGNNFRTRIYPIPANGCRRVIIGYEQLLGGKDNYSFLYSLPLHFKQPLKQFDFSITVASNYIPEVGSDCNTHLKFEELNKVFTSSVSEKDYTPDGTFNIVIPKTADAAEVSMQEVNGQYYFLINTFPTVKKIKKKIPDAITVIWDASLSGQKRDHKKEFDLLDGYIAAAGHLTVHLYQSGIDFKKIGDYSASAGNWSDLKKALEDIIYDGATDLSSIKFPPGEEYLLFTDGLNTFGNCDNLMLPQKPVYTICASATADHSMLKYIAAKTGGVFINLNELDTGAAKKFLTEQTLQFLGIKSNGNITDVYPSVVTPVGDNCSIAGISHLGNQTITLQFGYGTTVAAEQQIDMNINFQKTNFINIEKIWAQKKIADLDIQYEKNKDAISEMGKKYSVITRNTSLIVLELVSDYVHYGIAPPAELMEAYTSLMAAKRSVVLEKEKDKLAEAGIYFGEVKSWWDKDFKPIAHTKDLNSPSKPSMDLIRSQTIHPWTNDPFARVSPPPVAIGSEGNVTLRDSLRANNVTRPLRSDDAVATAVIKDHTPVATENMPIALVAGRPTATDRDGDGVEDAEDKCPDVAGYARLKGCPIPDTDHDGVNDEEDKCPTEPGPASNFGCPVFSETIIQKVNLASKNVYFRSNSSRLDPSVIDGSYASRPGSRFNAVYERKRRAIEEMEAKKKRAIEERETTTRRLNYAWTKTNAPAEINISELTPDKAYLQELAKLPKENRYQKYLELRENNNQPTFYFDVANMFFRDADTATGYRVLSNIAELNLDDHESCKMLGYRLKSLKRFDDEVMVFKKVMQLRPQDPQSYRDYALALADAGKFQQALDTLYLSLMKNYDDQIKNLYPGIEEIIVTEINGLIALHGNQLNISNVPKDLIRKMPVDVRLVLNWNMNDTDVDLWLIDPNGEKCYYGHRETDIGGRISRDFTRGYGPEQFMLKNTVKGKYKVIANYYGDSRQRIAGPTSVMAEIYTHYGTASVQRKVVALQMKGKESKEVSIAEFSF